MDGVTFGENTIQAAEELYGHCPFIVLEKWALTYSEKEILDALNTVKEQSRRGVINVRQLDGYIEASLRNGRRQLGFIQQMRHNLAKGNEDVA